MRFLKRSPQGELSLTEFIGNDIPPYVILSHTWGLESEEVTFKDIVDDTWKSKATTIGYKKIQFCEQQAQRHGISYFWVDTCSIDKSSSAELSEAINSMFRWYSAAVKCVVYLSDVSIHDYETTFSKSRWFTRGWTLQELIAPASVEFFSCEGELLGDKTSLGRLIHDITGIALPALGGDPLSQFAVDERLSWIKERETKRDEDLAYCLLGIFDVFMPLIYGEGREKAFLRLRRLIDGPSKGIARGSI
jgi:Heterokaryon incompatibility protein (HET)